MSRKKEKRKIKEEERRKKKLKLKRKERISSIFWGIFPFFFTIGCIIFYILISGGYHFFEQIGWNVNIIIFLRKLDHIFLLILCFGIFLFLLIFYLNLIRDWKKGYRSSGFPLLIEIILVSLFILGPALFCLYYSVVIVFILFVVDLSYWTGFWELK